jgi:hypothetical protein
MTSDVPEMTSEAAITEAADPEVTVPEVTDRDPEAETSGDGDRWTLPAFGALLAGLAEIDDAGDEELAIDEIRIACPVELDVVTEHDTVIEVRGSTPTQWTETTVLPVFHSLGMRITRSDGG